VRKAQGQETRQRILDAAVQLFALNGHDGTTVRDIASAASVPHTSIPYYFQTKEDLWREAVAQMFERLRTDVGGVDLAEGPEGYRQFIRRYVRYCARHPEHARLMVHESIRGGDRLDWAVANFLRPGHKSIGPTSAQLMAGGSLPSIWPWSMAFMLAAMCQAPFLRGAEFRALTGLDSQSDEVVEAHADAVIAVLFGMHEKPPGRDWPPAPDWLMPDGRHAIAPGRDNTRSQF
jgi:AcrR family transcriptional regulator